MARGRKGSRKQKNLQERFGRKRLSMSGIGKFRSNFRDERLKPSVHDRLGYNRLNNLSVHDRLGYNRPNNLSVDDRVGYNREKGMFRRSGFNSGISPLNRNESQLLQYEPRNNLSVHDRLGYNANRGMFRSGFSGYSFKNRGRGLKSRPFKKNRQQRDNLYMQVNSNQDQMKSDIDDMYVVVGSNQFQPMHLQDMCIEVNNDQDWIYNEVLEVYTKSNLKIYPTGIFHFDHGMRSFRSETFHIEHVIPTNRSQPIIFNKK